MARRLQAVQSRADARQHVEEFAEGVREVASPYLDARQALAYLQLRSLSVLYYHIRENRLPTLRRGGRYLFDKRELDAWLRESRGTAALMVRRSS